MWLIGGCTQVGTGLTPCTTIMTVTAGEASKLTVGGVAVLLETLAGITNGNPDKSFSANAGQTKLTAT